MLPIRGITQATWGLTQARCIVYKGNGSGADSDRHLFWENGNVRRWKMLPTTECGDFSLIVSYDPMRPLNPAVQFN